ncbi:MAG: hypothetical protein WCE40_09575 [Polyangia bacterium]
MSEVLERGGWNRRLIDGLLGAPDRLAPNPHYRRAAPMRLFALDRVAAAEKTAAFLEHLALLERREAQVTAAGERRCARFSAAYSSWLEALPAACEAMFNLNRYAKWHSCSGAHRDAIYGLKNQLVKLLYERNFCEVAWLHEVTPLVGCCFACNGEGADWSDALCLKCGGSGAYVPPVRRYACFAFVVAGQRYTWHQPIDSLSFEPVYTKTAETWVDSIGEKPIELAAKKFAEAKELVGWVLASAAKDVGAVDIAGSSQGCP